MHDAVYVPKNSRLKSVSVPTLFRLWSDNDLTVTEVARELGIDVHYLYTLADRHKLPQRKRVSRCDTFDAVNTPEEEEASANSLALSPYVQRRIIELRLGMPDAEPVNATPWSCVLENDDEDET
jgi:hypothetical protein